MPHYSKVFIHKTKHTTLEIHDAELTYNELSGLIHVKGIEWKWESVYEYASLHRGELYSQAAGG